MAGSGRRVGARKTGILHPGWKAALESDAYGDQNASTIFVAMATKLYMEWDTLSKERGLKKFASKIIVVDVLLYGHTARQLIAYFRTFLDVLKHHRDTLRLKKCK